MAATNTDKFRKTYAGPATTLVTGIDASQDNIQLVSVSGWPTDTAIDVIIDRIDAEGNLTPDKQEIVTGVVDPTGLINVIRGQDSTAQVHATGAVAEPSINSSKSHNDMVDALLETHKQDGTLGDEVVGTENIAPNAVTADNIDFTTPTVNVADCNDTTMPAKTYYCDSTTDNIPMDTEGFLTVLKQNDTNITQIFTRYSDNNVWQRQNNSETSNEWSDWKLLNPTFNYCKMMSSGSQSVSNTSGTRTAINLGTTVYSSNDDMFSTGSNKITFLQPGLYIIFAEVRCTDVENFFALISTSVATVLSQLSFAGRTSTSRGFQSSNGLLLANVSAGNSYGLWYENRGLATTINYAALTAIRIA